jgi:signal transduction histidine kinase
MADHRRASDARELHDGVLQSLLRVEMRLDVLSDSQEGSSAQELRQIQDILREEAGKLRELMQQVKPLDVDAQESAISPHGDR